MDTEVEFQNSMFCIRCLNEKPKAQNKIIGLDFVISMIKKGFFDQKQEDEKLIYLKHLNLFQDKMSELKVDLIKYIDKIILNTQKWIKYLDNFQRKDSILKDLEEFHLNKYRISTYQERMKKENSTYLLDCFPPFKCFCNKIDQRNVISTYQQLKIIKENSGERGNISKRKLSPSHVMMLFWQLLACENTIKIYPFKNGIIGHCQTVLTGHTNKVQCLMIRKNWIISGSLDNSIKVWRYIDEPVSTATDFYFRHQNAVIGLILNKKEDELISYSKDRTNKVWKLNGVTNKINFHYNLDPFQSGAINCVSINPSETLLISCDDDKDIVLWNKSWNQRWSPRRTLSQEDDAMRVSFISDTQFILQFCHQGTSIILNVDNQKLSLELQAKLFLNEANNDEWLFPTLYNEKNRLQFKNIIDLSIFQKNKGMMNLKLFKKLTV